jgi:hypothetical protein
MICYLSTSDHQRPIREYLESHGAALAGVFEPMTYPQFFQAREHPHGAYVFSDIERLSEPERLRAESAWQELAGRGCRLLNHPTRSMRRFELLRALHQRGSNDFAVHRLAAGAEPPRLPVFLRRENDHRGPRTPLLGTPAELAAEVERWRRSGEALGEVIATEFCDTADADRVYRKYGAFLLGDRVIPRHVFFSEWWNVKSWNLAGDDYLAEELDYLLGNPHQQELREIFALARIDYGRIDYALLDGRIQVWEINTNPMIVRPTAARSARHAVHARFAAALEVAWKEVAASTVDPGREG